MRVSFQWNKSLMGSMRLLTSDCHHDKLVICRTWCKDGLGLLCLVTWQDNPLWRKRQSCNWQIVIRKGLHCRERFWRDYSDNSVCRTYCDVLSISADRQTNWRHFRNLFPISRLHRQVSNSVFCCIGFDQFPLNQVRWTFHGTLNSVKYWSIDRWEPTTSSSMLLSHKFVDDNRLLNQNLPATSALQLYSA